MWHSEHDTVQTITMHFYTHSYSESERIPMHKRIYATLSSLLLVTTLSLNATTSADLSCTAPLVVNTSTTITLNADVSITDLCALILAGPDFGTTQTDTVVFTSTTGNKIVVANAGTWDPATFNTNTKQIAFSGDAVLAVNNGGVLIISGPLSLLGAQLALYQGAIMWLNNGTLTNSGTIETIATEN
jgi:hypothetical protein